MAAKKTILKLVFSAAAAVVLLVSVYFMLGSDLRGYGVLFVNREGQDYAGFFRDLVGRSVELDKQTFAESLAAAFQRRIDGERDKIDFLIEQLSDVQQSRTEDSGTASSLQKFVDAHPLIEEALLINGKYEVLLSTADEKRFGTVLDREVYREVFASDVDGDLVDEAAQSIVFYRKLESGHALLFYYTNDFLESVFSDMPGFDYSRATVTAERVVLINFPVMDESERENLRNLSQRVWEQKSGFVRIRRDQLDKTVYFLPVAQAAPTWIVAVTYNTEQLRISTIGVIILAVQAFVVAAIIIFILTTVRERRSERPSGVAIARALADKRRKGAVEDGMGVTQQTGIEADAVAADEVSEIPAEATEDAALPLPEKGDVISLDDVEEVTELQEFGEAEIAQEYQEYEDSQPVLDEAAVQPAAVQPAADMQSKKRASAATTPPEAESIPEAESLPESETIPEASPVQKTEHKHDAVSEEREEHMPSSNDSVELLKLEAVQREIMGREAHMLEEIEELKTLDQYDQTGDVTIEHRDEEIADRDENIEEIPIEALEGGDEYLDDLSLELHPKAASDDFVIDDLSDVAGRSISQGEYIPDLEALAGAGIHPAGGEEPPEGDKPADEEKPAEIDEPVVEEEPPGGGRVAESGTDLEKGFVPSDLKSAEPVELQRHDEEGASIRHTFDQFLHNVGIHKGAVLLRQSTGIYKPCVVTGFSRETEPKLIFSGKEKIVSKVLMRDKILHIRNNVFMDDELGKKFSRADTSTIHSVYFAPLMSSGSDLAGFILLGPTQDESTDSPSMLKKIKEIKKSLTNIL